MNTNLKEYVWVFVGCGGTFHAASPYLAVLAKKYCRGRVLFIDPDSVEEGNASRQWPWYSPGVTKSVAGAIAVLGDNDANPGPVDVYEVVGRFHVGDSLLGESTDGRPVIVIVNVDNDEVRLNIADWLESRISPGIMVVSGCERTFGQCYAGVWNEGEAILDWRRLHPDVGVDPDRDVNSCSVQTMRSNALTGTLVGMCIEDIARWLADGAKGDLSEFYWGISDESERVNMWELLVPTRRQVTA